MRDTAGRAAILAIGFILAEDASAQQAPPPPPPVQGQALPSRGQVENDLPATAPAPPTAEVDDREAFRGAPCALAGSPVQVSIRTVRFVTPDGAAAAPALQRLLGRIQLGTSDPQSIAVVCRIRDEANALLSGAGYVALAQIPEQEIRDGELKIQIVTARIVEIRLLGDLGPFRRAVQPRLKALLKLDPLNRKDAERILLQISDVPGVHVRLALSSAGGKAGEVIGSLSVEKRRVQLVANVQNYGSRQLGPTIGALRGEVYGLTGFADRTYVAYSNSTDWRESRAVQVGHEFTPVAGGPRIGLRGVFAYSRPDIEGLDLRSRAQILGADFTQPFLRRLDRQLDGTAGLEVLDQRSQLFQADKAVPFTRDRIRVGFGRLVGQATLRTTRGVPVVTLSGNAELRKGLDILGASARGKQRDGYSPSRFDGNPLATVLRGELAADVRLHRLFSLGLRGFGQWANDPLLNLEEFSIGNAGYGRGYDPGANGGDRAYAFRVEPRVAVPAKLPVQVELFGFYDHVRLYNLDTGSQEKDRLLRSAGGGVRLVRAGLMVVDAMYAHPLDRALTTDKAKPRDRFLLSITAQILPFGVRR
jgi:hemolysin activation/secretion protein